MFASAIRKFKVISKQQQQNWKIISFIQINLIYSIKQMHAMHIEHFVPTHLFDLMNLPWTDRLMNMGSLSHT